jgi:hypothetical protein
MPGRRMLTYEYILIDGVDSSHVDAEKLARLLADQRCKINLIVFNPDFPFHSSAFRMPLSNRGYAPRQLIEQFIVSIWCGACRFAHAEIVRLDHVLCRLFSRFDMLIPFRYQTIN